MRGVDEMTIALSLAIMVVILCSLYLYDDYRKKHLKEADSKIDYNNLIPILKYGF